MYFEQFYLGCLSHASYLIGDPDSGKAAVVDPQRDVEQYLHEAARNGLRIEHVILTHFHADFLAGHLELRNQTGARIHLGARAQAEYAFEPMRDGDRLILGSVALDVLETPGHTPEGISLVVREPIDAEIPDAVLTGDTLFIGDVGRPDLLASSGVTERELAEALYDSLHEKLLRLPDSTKVCPAHGAGSMCGKNLSNETISTIGEQRKYNYALQPMDREAFVKLVATGQPSTPSYFAYDADLNRRERTTLDENRDRALEPLELDEVLALRDQNAQLLDVRSARDYVGAHLPGTINIGLDGRFATWAGTLLDRERPIVLIAEPGTENEAVTRLGRIGFDHVAGYLVDGMGSLLDRPDQVRTEKRHTAAALQDALASDDPPLVVDIRSPGELENGYIEGSHNIPLPDLAERVNELPRDRPIVVQCAGGYRSSAGACILRQLGFERVTDLIGGIRAWKTCDLPCRVSEPQ